MDSKFEYLQNTTDIQADYRINYVCADFDKLFKYSYKDDHFKLLL